VTAATSHPEGALIVNAAGTRGGGAFPNFTLKYGDTILGEATVTSNSLRQYMFEAPLPFDVSQLRIIYNNDYFSWWRGDRNLRVDSVEARGALYKTTDPSVYSVGAWTGRSCGTGGYYSSNWLACNGYFQFGKR
jgi:hypothetical protein